MTHNYLVRSDDPRQTAGPVLDGEGGPYRLIRAGLGRLKLGVLSWGRRWELSAEMLFICVAMDARSSGHGLGANRWGNVALPKCLRRGRAAEGKGCS